MRPNKFARGGDGTATIFEMSVPQRPCVNHLWPDLQSHCDFGRTGPRSKPNGVFKQCLFRTNLNQPRRKASKISVKRRDARILSVHTGGEIRIRQLIQVFFVNERISRGFAYKSRTGHRQIRPRRDEPHAPGKLLVRVAQPAEQSESESGPVTIATYCNFRSIDALISQKSPRIQRVIVSCGKRMLGREPIGNSKCLHSRRPSRFSDPTTMTLYRTGTIAAAVKKHQHTRSIAAGND